MSKGDSFTSLKKELSLPGGKGVFGSQVHRANGKMFCMNREGEEKYRLLLNREPFPRLSSAIHLDTFISAGDGTQSILRGR